jgi:hypothetical protein
MSGLYTAATQTTVQKSTTAAWHSSIAILPSSTGLLDFFHVAAGTLPPPSRSTGGVIWAGAGLQLCWQHTTHSYARYEWMLAAPYISLMSACPTIMYTPAYLL